MRKTKQPPRIEKGIPMWSPHRGHEDFYLWKDMEIGDSFFIANIQPAKASSLCYSTSRRMAPKKFVCRAFKKGARVWRIADRPAPKAQTVPSCWVDPIQVCQHGNGPNCPICAANNFMDKELLSGFQP